MYALRSHTPMAALAAAAALSLTVSIPAPAGASIPASAGAGPVSAGAGQAISVSPTGPVRTVTPALLGLNAVNVTGPRWDDSKLDAVLAKFGPGALRYPGGTNANYWDWQTGWFQPGRWPAEPPGTPIDDKIGVFGTGLSAAGAAPMFVLNVLTYQGAVGSDSVNAAMLRGQLQFLHAAAAAGMPVKMVELGNELYLNGAVSGGKHGKDYETRFPTAADYATQMNTWIAAIHKAFPGVQVAPVAADPNYISGVSGRRRNWDSAVLPPLKGEDVMSVHEIQRVKQSGPVPTVLAQPYIRYQTFAANQLPLFTARKLPLWITAFNMEDQTPGHTLQGTWLHGLYVAEQALLYLANPDFRYIGLSGSIGTAHGGAIFDGTDGLGAGKPATVPLALTAAGTTLAAIQSVFHGATQSQALAFSPVPALGSTGAPALLGEDVSTPSGRQLVLVNASSKPVTLNLSTLFPSGFTASQTTAASITTLITGPTSTTTSTATGTGQVTIGPYTLATVSG
jgi:hypothetical protein